MIQVVQLGVRPELKGDAVLIWNSYIIAHDVSLMFEHVEELVPEYVSLVRREQFASHSEHQMMWLQLFHRPADLALGVLEGLISVESLQVHLVPTQLVLAVVVLEDDLRRLLK